MKNEAEILAFIVQCFESMAKKSRTVTTTPSVFATSAAQQPPDGSSSCDLDCCLLSINDAEAYKLEKEHISKLDIIGQFNDGFIVCKSVDDHGCLRLLAVDQHAADERIRFEEIAAFNEIKRQKLLHPYKIKTSPEKEEIIQKRLVDIQAAGFSLSNDQNGTWFLNELPNFHGFTCSAEGIRFYV